MAEVQFEEAMTCKVEKQVEKQVKQSVETQNLGFLLHDPNRRASTFRYKLETQFEKRRYERSTQ